MTELKSKVIISAASLFTLIGTVTAAKPVCMGRFYRPEIPEILKGPIKKKKGVIQPFFKKKSNHRNYMKGQ